LASLNHPNVVKLFEVFEKTESELLYLVMELCTGGELFQRISTLGAYSEVDAAGVCSQMCQAIQYLHTQPEPIVHMDLKPENWLCLTPESDQLKLVDFGSSIKWNRESEDYFSIQSFSKEYAAPEALLEKSRCTEKYDIFSLGVILYVLLTGHPPFEIPTKSEFEKHQPLQKRQFLKLSVEARRLLTSMLDFEPTQRPSAQAILEGHWCQAKNQGAVGEPMDPKVINGIRASHFRRVCLNMLAWSTTATVSGKLQKCFADLDTGKVGKLSLSEFRRVLEKELSIHEATQILASIQEEDNPGEICYTDFLVAVMRERVRLHKRSLYSLWTTLSSSGCNSASTISAASLQGMLSDFDAADVAALIQELDAGSTGEISFQSFQVLISSLVTAPQADLEVTEKERQRKFVEMAVRLIDNELTGVHISSWPCYSNPAKMTLPSLDRVGSA